MARDTDSSGSDINSENLPFTSGLDNNKRLSIEAYLAEVVIPKKKELGKKFGINLFRLFGLLESEESIVFPLVRNVYRTFITSL